jgi:hypothetical protein
MPVALLALLTLSLRLSPPGASAPNASERLKPLAKHVPPPRLVEAAQASKHETFNSPNWPALAEQLNRLPTFTVANERGQPLQARGSTCSVLPRNLGQRSRGVQAIRSHTNARLRSANRP